jgi:UDP-N-acetylmuramoyl-tripeptide--D-alanyl-D-alanine ligase
MNLALAEIAQICNGQLFGDAALAVHSVGTDTRTLQHGALFVALRGERVDAHDLLAQAQLQGASAALVERKVAHAIPQILVANSALALGALAKAWRAKVSAKRIAITGSNGKTTVKNLTSSILQQCGNTLATSGNLNNELGLPLSVLAIRAEHQFAVLEMGAGKPGDIAYLADIGGPQISLVNNAMAAHLERLGSIHGVAEEKSAIYRGLLPGGVAVINADDAEVATFARAAASAKARVQTFSLTGNTAAFFASDVRLGASTQFILHTPIGHCQIQLALVGAHNVANALAAAALAIAAGASLDAVVAGLNQAQAAAGRLNVCPQSGGWTVLDDSYNANPGSLKAGIDALVALPGTPWLVLGNMAELGADASGLHAQIGAHARAAGVQRLFCFGALAEHAALAAGAIAQNFDSLDALAAALKAELGPGVNLLVKGSRSARMERVLSLLGSSMVSSITNVGSAH